MRLYNKLVLVFLGLLAICTLVSATAFYLISEETIEKVFIDIISEQNDNYIKNFNKFITENIRISQFLIKDQRIQKWNYNLTALGEYLNDISIVYPHFESILLLDLKGIVQANSIQVDLQKRYKYFDYLQKIAKSEDYHWDFVVDEVFYKGKYLLIKKINEFNNSGYLVFETSVSQIDNYFGKINKLIGGIIAPKYNIQLESKKMLMSNFAFNENVLELMTIHNEFEEKPNVRIFEDEEHIFIENKNIESVQMFGQDDNSGQSHSHWSLTTRISKEDLESPVHTIRNTLIWLFLILFLLSSIVLYTWLKKEILPLTKLVNKIDELGTGKFEKIEVSDNLNYDIHQLLTGYNEMIVELEKTIFNLNNSSKFAVLGEMASGIAHEINNPLQIIRGFAEMQIRSIQNNKIEKTIDYSNKIISVTDRIAKIVVALKTYAHNQNNEKFEIQSIRKIIDDTLIFCEQKFKLSAIELRISLQPPSLKIACHSIQISQVLLNLLNNAYDAVTEQDVERWIEIDVVVKNNMMVLSVLNSGKKIDDSIATKMFQPFFTTKPVGKGTGLGMSIVKNLVEQHKGEVKLDMTSYHTKFVIEIPINQDLNLVKEVKNKIAS